jgi:hypothetical protein
VQSERDSFGDVVVAARGVGRRARGFLEGNNVNNYCLCAGEWTSQSVVFGADTEGRESARFTIEFLPELDIVNCVSSLLDAGFDGGIISDRGRIN